MPADNQQTIRTLLRNAHATLLKCFSDSPPNYFRADIRRFRRTLQTLIGWARRNQMDELENDARWHERYWFQREYSDSRFEPADESFPERLPDLGSYCSALMLNIMTEEENKKGLIAAITNPVDTSEDQAEQYGVMFWESLPVIEVAAPEWRDAVVGSAITVALKTTDPGNWNRRFITEIASAPWRFGVSDFRVTFHSSGTMYEASGPITAGVLYRGRWSRQSVTRESGRDAVDALVDASVGRMSHISMQEFRNLIDREYSLESSR